MTTCQVCHEHDAVVHLTEVIGDTVTTLHLCGKCAAERGVTADIDLTSHSPLGSFLAALGQGSLPVSTAAASREACAACGATLQDVRASGRLGCPLCWTTFERPLRDLVRRIHGATRHTGKWYDDPSQAEFSELRISAHTRVRLQEALRVAVADEAFELAAELRDQLRSISERG